MFQLIERKMVIFQNVLMLYALQSYINFINADDPCDTKHFINDYKRSAAYDTDSVQICDNTLHPGWYRITSGAGERMPTECINFGSRCNTAGPIWLSNDNVQADEDLFPAEGVQVNRTVYTSDIYDCKSKSYNIQIKGCDGYLVYKLAPTNGCYSAYCFGDQLPCPDGESSETGFTPACGISSNFTRKPFVTSELKELPGKFKERDFIFSNITFTCRADDLDDVYKYSVRWYVADLELKSAKQKNLTRAEIANGDAILHQEHWTSLFRPNFIVQCSLSVWGNGYEVPGPQNFSEPFFAGIKTDQTEYVVSETKTITIPVWSTIPIPCGWPASAYGALKQRFKDQCHLNLLNGVPKYQQDTRFCADGISNEGLAFNTQKCGIAFTHSKWDEISYLNITGAADNLVNLKDRIVFLRIYNNLQNSLPNEHFVYMFPGVTLPDIKVIILDEDKFTLGTTSCKSVNDPHMYSFDQRRWELQVREFGEGEFIMYEHERLPLQINAYFRKCNRGIALCNCGLAVRSGESLFVANFCETTVTDGGVSKRRANRYIVESLCDEESLIVQEAGNKITITLPTGTLVEFSHGQVYHFYGLHTISITPSSLDREVTRGLCGKFNGNPSDDFIPRKGFIPEDRITFVNSWKITESNKNLDLTLFHPNGTLPKTQYFGQEYCTCKINGTTYPYENPYFSCNLTSAMKTCRSSRTTTSVIRTSCSTSAYQHGRSKRSIDNDDEEDQFPRFSLTTDDEEPTNETAEWSNGWTEESAREFCTKSISNAPNYGPCMEHVPYLNSSSYITTCILDIKYQGGTDWIQATLSDFSTTCIREAKKSENLTSSTTTTNSGKTISILDLIEEVSCPNNCSGNGLCIKAECNCTEGYFGFDCALDRSTTPDIMREAFDDVCDTTKRPCRKFTIPGLNFIQGSLVCNMTSFSMVNNGTETTLVLEETFSHPGIYKSSFLMYCELPPSRQRRSIDTNSTATVYTLTISNNGLDFTDELTVMVFDSNCYICNTSSLSCEIKDSCKTAQIDETDDKSNTLIIVLAVVASVVLMFVVVLIFLWTNLFYRKMSSYVSDSSMSLKKNLNKG